MSPKITLALVLLGLSGIMSQETKEVSIKLFATDLSGCDDLSKCDPFVRIYCQNKLSDWKVCGQTSVRDNDNFPIWPELFTFNITEGNRDKWDFKLIDDDLTVDDQITSVELSVELFLNATNTQFTYVIPLPEVNAAAKLYVERY